MTRMKKKTGWSDAFFIHKICASRGQIFLPHPGEGFLAVAERTFQLPRLDCFEDFAKTGTGLQTKRDQIVALHEGRRDDRFIGKFLPLALEELIVIEHSVAARAIDAM